MGRCAHRFFARPLARESCVMRHARNAVPSALARLFMIVTVSDSTEGTGTAA